MKLLAILAIGTLALSCGTKKNAATDAVQESGADNKNSKTMHITARIDKMTDNSDSAPFTINSIEIKGNIMLMVVTYSGGCQEHSFDVIGSNATAKSLPPIRSVQIKHHSNNDLCKKMERKTLEIDISSLADHQTPGSEIYLTFEGWEDRILYTYE